MNLEIFVKLLLNMLMEIKMNLFFKHEDKYKIKILVIIN